MWLTKKTKTLHEQCWLRSMAAFRMLVLLKKQLFVRLAGARMQRRKPVSIQPVSVHMIRPIYACASARIAGLDLASDN